MSNDDTTRSHFAELVGGEVAELNRTKTGGAMTTLQPFNPSASCPKCGSEKVITSYSQGRASGECQRRNDTYLWPEHEHQRRHCTQCHYEWPEACDAACEHILMQGEIKVRVNHATEEQSIAIRKMVDKALDDLQQAVRDVLKG